MMRKPWLALLSRTFTFELARRGRPQSASNMTTWINSQFPRPDFHRRVQWYYGLQDTGFPPGFPPRMNRHRISQNQELAASLFPVSGPLEDGHVSVDDLQERPRLIGALEPQVGVTVDPPEDQAQPGFEIERGLQVDQRVIDGGHVPPLAVHGVTDAGWPRAFAATAAPVVDVLVPAREGPGLGGQPGRLPGRTGLPRSATPRRPRRNRGRGSRAPGKCRSSAASHR